MIIVDTNVLSESLKPEPAPSVLAWVNRQPEGILFLTSVTEAELLYGLELMPHGRKRNKLYEATMAILSVDFADRILPFDSSATRACAEIMVTRRRMGRPIEWADGQIAAIARARGFAVATRKSPISKAAGPS